MVIKLLGLVGQQWKGIMALSAAALVGASGGAYMTLPRAVSELQRRAARTEDRLDRIEMQTGLMVCLKLVEYKPEKEQEAEIQSCVLEAGESLHDNDDS